MLAHHYLVCIILLKLGKTKEYFKSQLETVKDKHQTPQFKTITARDKEDKKQLSSNISNVSRE